MAAASKALLAVAPASAQIPDDVVRVGITNDRTGAELAQQLFGAACVMAVEMPVDQTLAAA